MDFNKLNSLITSHLRQTGLQLTARIFDSDIHKIDGSYKEKITELVGRNLNLCPCPALLGITVFAALTALELIVIGAEAKRRDLSFLLK